MVNQTCIEKDLVKEWKELIIGDRVTSLYVLNLIEDLSVKIPEIEMVKSILSKITFESDKEQFENRIKGVLDRNGLDLKTQEEFFRFFSFDKKNGYSMRGLSFVDEGLIVINLNQIHQSVSEYRRHAKMSERDKNRDRRYYAKDCHYQDYETYIQSDEEAFQFFLWNSLIEQIRYVQISNSIGLNKNSHQAEYPEEGSLIFRDSIGYAKYIFKNFILKV